MRVAQNKLRDGHVRNAMGNDRGRSAALGCLCYVIVAVVTLTAQGKEELTRFDHAGVGRNGGCSAPAQCKTGPDRKSTRLNSSHVKISYAVFCLKKKKKKRQTGC